MEYTNVQDLVGKTIVEAGTLRNCKTKVLDGVRLTFSDGEVVQFVYEDGEFVVQPVEG